MTYPKTFLSAKQVSVSSESNASKNRLVSLASIFLTTGATLGDVVSSSAVKNIEVILCGSPSEDSDGNGLLLKYAEFVKDLCGDNRDLMKAVKVQDVGRREGQLMNWRAKIRSKYNIGVWDHSKLDDCLSKKLWIGFVDVMNKFNLIN